MSMPQGDRIAADVARAVAARRAIFAEPEPVPAAVAKPGSNTSSGTWGKEPPVVEQPATEQPVVELAVADTLTDTAPTAAAPRTGGSRRSTDPGGAVGGQTPRRSRRRFSLPPLDADDEKISRSIETFLGGADPVADQLPAPGGGGRSSAAVTTVAFVAVSGLVAPAIRLTPDTALMASPGTDGGSSLEVGPDGSDSAAILAAVERTLRSAARGSDQVLAEAGEPFRILLPGTGELAARAYLRRIRATIEPLLEATDRPLHLAIATATVLDEPLDVGISRAAERLAVTLALAGSEDGGTVGEKSDPLESASEPG